jgi:hypothetical protein
MTWHPYLIDNIAQKIVLDAIIRDQEKGTKSLAQAHRLRSSCAYGLERFWGEQIRLINENNPNDKAKGEFTREVWQALAAIMHSAGVELPSDRVTSLPGKLARNDTSPYLEQVQNACNQIRALDKNATQASLSVLSTLCDAIVWWKQRLSKEARDNG